MTALISRTGAPAIQNTLMEAYESDDNFPLMVGKDDDIRHVVNFDDGYSVETWISGSGVVINFLMGRFGSQFKDIKAKWGYASLETAIADIKVFAET